MSLRPIFWLDYRRFEVLIRGKYIYLFADCGQGIVQKNDVLREKFMVQTFQIITKNLSKTTDNKQSLKIYLKIG